MVTIVALGDSTTAGTPQFKSPIEAPPSGRGDEKSQFAYWLMQAHPDWRVLNRGVNGETADDIEARFDRDVLKASPSVVIVIAGVNDVYGGREPADVTRVLRSIYDRAARDANLVFADTRKAAAAPGNLDRLAGSPDGLHPDIDGYHKMADALAPAIALALTRK